MNEKKSINAKNCGLQSHFEQILPQLKEFGLNNYKIYKTSYNNMHDGNLIVIDDGNFTKLDYTSCTDHIFPANPNVDYSKTLNIYFHKRTITVSYGQLSFSSLFLIKIEDSFDTEFISQICEFVMFVVKSCQHNFIILHKYFSGKNHGENYTHEYLKNVLNDKGISLLHKEKSIHNFFVNNYSQYRINNGTIGLGRDSMTFSLKSTKDLSIDFKILPSYNESRVLLLCDLLSKAIIKQR